MKTVKFIYEDNDGNVLLIEQGEYCMIPPIGRCIVWLTINYIVTNVIEVWDECTVRILLKVNSDLTFFLEQQAVK